MDPYGSNLLLSQEPYPSIDFTLLDRPSSSIASAQYSTASLLPDTQSRESPDYPGTSATFTTGGFRLEPEELQARYNKEIALYSEAACEMPPSLLQRQTTTYSKARNADGARNSFEPTKTVHQTQAEPGRWLSHDFWTPASHRDSYLQQPGKTEMMQGFAQVAKNPSNLRLVSSDDATPQMMNFLPQQPSDTRKSSGIGFVLDSDPAGNSFSVKTGQIPRAPGQLNSESASLISAQQGEQEVLWNYVRNMRNACLDHDLRATTQTLQNSGIEQQREPPGQWNCQQQLEELHRQQQVQQHVLWSRAQQLCFLPNLNQTYHFAIHGHPQGFPQERTEACRPLQAHNHQYGNAGYPLIAVGELPSVQNLTNGCITGEDQVVPWQRAARRPSPSVGPFVSGRIGQTLNSQGGLQDFFGGGGNLTQERNHLPGSISRTSVMGENQKEVYDFNNQGQNRGPVGGVIFGQIPKQIPFPHSPQERREVNGDISHWNSQLVQQLNSNDNLSSNNRDSSSLVGSLILQQENVDALHDLGSKKQFAKPLLARMHGYLEGQVQPVQKDGAWHLNNDQQFGRVSDGPDTVCSSRTDNELASCLQSANRHQEISRHAETRQWKALPHNGPQLRQSPSKKCTQEELHSLKANYLGGLNGDKRNGLLLSSHIGVHNAENQESQVFDNGTRLKKFQQERKDFGVKQYFSLTGTEVGCSNTHWDAWSQLQSVTSNTGLPSVSSNLEATYINMTLPKKRIPETRQNAAPSIQQLDRLSGRAHSRNGDTLQLLNSTKGHETFHQCEASALFSPRHFLAPISPRNVDLRLAPPSIIFSGSSASFKGGTSDGPTAMTQTESIETDAHVGKSEVDMMGLSFGKPVVLAEKSSSLFRGSTADVQKLEKASLESKADPDCNGEIINDGVMDAECMSKLLDNFRSSLSAQKRAGKIYPGIFESSHEAAITNYETERPDLPMRSSCLLTQLQSCPQPIQLQLNSAARCSSDHQCNSTKWPIQLNSPVQRASTSKRLQPQLEEDKLLDQDITIQAMQSSQRTNALPAVRAPGEESDACGRLENHPQAICRNTADGSENRLKAVKFTNLAEHLQQPQETFASHTFGKEVAAPHENSKQSESVITYSRVDGQSTDSQTNSLQDQTCNNSSQASEGNSTGFIQHPPCSNISGSGETRIRVSSPANSENKSDLKPPLPGLPLKRKREFIPWRIATSQQARPLPSTSGPELQSSVARARIPETDDGGEHAQDPVLRAKERLQLTTQIMQHVVSPLPATLMRSNASDERACGIYIYARSAMEEACRLALSSSSYGADFVLYSDATSSEDTPNLVTAAAQMELFKDFKERFTQLESSLIRLENFSALQFAKGSEEEEKLAILDRLAPRRYVTASPMPSVLPESQHVVSL